MSDTAPATINLRSNGNDHYQEYPLSSAGTPITPGMLVQLTSSNKAVPNPSAADVDPEVIVAVEMDILGRTIDDNYVTADEAVKCWYPKSGDHCYMFLEAAGNVAAGASLESNGAGYLQALSTGKHIFTAAEAVDNSGGGSAVRIRVRKV